MKGLKIYRKICALCGKEFTAHHIKRMYCCKSCCVQAYQLRKEKAKIGAIQREKFLQNEYAKYLAKEKENMFTKLGIGFITGLNVAPLTYEEFIKQYYGK